MPPARPDEPSRVAVIGDIAGHLEELRGELVRLGADPGTGRLPDDLTVVQVGDLVHRGPASDGVVALVDRYLTEQPEHWIQLVGNHEAQYLHDPVFDWPERISDRSRDTLRGWWAGGAMRAAAWVPDDLGGFLVTHAGLTADFWHATLGAPATADQAAEAVNSLIGVHDEVLFRAGEMLRGRRRSSIRRAAPGPVWAATATELLPGWLGAALPFSQIHGHDSIYDWQSRSFPPAAGNSADDTLAELARVTVVDEQAKHETTVLAGGLIIGVDPGHGREPRRPWRAWELRGSPRSPVQVVPGLGGSGSR